MQTRLKKIDYTLSNFLEREIDSDINNAIRKLLQTLRNEAVKIEKEQILERNKTILENNMKELSELDEKENKYWSELKLQLESALCSCLIVKETISLKLKYPKLINPTYEYESTDDWKKLILRDLELNLTQNQRKIDEIDRQLSSLNDIRTNNNPYHERKILLDDQIKRIHLENNRAKEIIEIYGKFDEKRNKGIDTDKPGINPCTG